MYTIIDCLSKHAYYKGTASVVQEVSLNSKNAAVTVGFKYLVA